METPFVVGTKVAIMNRHSDEPSSSAKIAKVYKNGNFVLEGGMQQYKPHGYRGFGSDDAIRWFANEVGNKYPSTVRLWDGILEKEMIEIRARRRIERLCRQVQDAVGRLHNSEKETIEMLAHQIMSARAIGDALRGFTNG